MTASKPEHGDESVNGSDLIEEQEIEEMALEAEELADAIRPMLSGDPAVIGAALAQLLALFIAGHHPDARAESLDKLLACTKELIPQCVEEMIEEGRITEEWRG